ncbi:alpha-lytic protease prodomain-containing protein [Streptomyces atratus]|uniref:alpha-lytic protease prodomain-containing protein n=1 Tax=Streptomyces atratus TaxID=1893 RepID=UPI003F53E829
MLVSPAALAAPEPITEPAKTAASAASLGDDHAAGDYYKDGRLVVAVTDQATATSVESAGGTPETVAHSAAEQNSVDAELDQLAGIPNTAWGVDPSANQVPVEIYARTRRSARAARGAAPGGRSECLGSVLLTGGTECVRGLAHREHEGREARTTAATADASSTAPRFWTSIWRSPNASPGRGASPRSRSDRPSSEPTDG